MGNKNEQLKPELQALILKFLEVTEYLPLSPAARKRNEDLTLGKAITCPYSGKVYAANEVEVLDNGHFKILNYLHPDLRRDLKGMCPIACIKCRDVVAWKAPGRDEEGFVMEPGKIYHIHYCPKCEPDKFKGETVTELIEKQLFRKYN